MIIAAQKTVPPLDNCSPICDHCVVYSLSTIDSLLSWWFANLGVYLVHNPEIELQSGEDWHTVHNKSKLEKSLGVTCVGTGARFNKTTCDVPKLADNNSSETRGECEVWNKPKKGANAEKGRRSPECVADNSHNVLWGKMFSLRALSDDVRSHPSAFILILAADDRRQMLIYLHKDFIAILFLWSCSTIRPICRNCAAPHFSSKPWSMSRATTCCNVPEHRCAGHTFPVACGWNFVIFRGLAKQKCFDKSGNFCGRLQFVAVSYGKGPQGNHTGVRGFSLVNLAQQIENSNFAKQSCMCT